MTSENTAQSETIKVNTDQMEYEGISLLDLLLVVVENLRLLVLGPLFIGLVTLGISFMIAPTYTAKTQFLPPQFQQSSASTLVQALGMGLSGGGIGAGLGLKNPVDQFISFLKSRTIQDNMVERFDLMKRYGAKSSESAGKVLISNTKFTSKKDGLIIIELDDKDPQFAADMANAYVEELGRLMNRLSFTEAKSRRVFFEKKLILAKENLFSAEEALRSSGVSRGVIKINPGAAVEVTARLKANITVQEIKIANMRGFLAETSPEFLQAMKELSVLKEQFTKSEKYDSNPGDSLYISRFRDFKYQETLYELYSKQYEIARIDESREGTSVQILDAAVVPKFKSKPRKAEIALLATIATGFVLLLFVFVRQAWRNVFQDENAAKKLQAIKVSWQKAFWKTGIN
jgi:tyrosine-protein kinase Etk/Wzc